MAELFFWGLPDPDMDPGLLVEKSPAGVLFRNEFFGVPAVGGDTVYVGAGTRATRYLGTRLDADLYLGAKTLWP